MFGKLFNKKSDLSLKNEIAEYLKINPKKLHDFEAAYRAAAIEENRNSDNFFDIGAKEMSEEVRSFSGTLPDADEKKLSETINVIADDLYRKTDRISVTDGTVSRMKAIDCKDSEMPVTNEVLNRFPEGIRPQLTGTLMKVDISKMSSDMLLMNLVELKKSKDPRKKLHWYHLFRQGLDILDLDDITYRMLGLNRNSIGYWLPQVCKAVHAHGFFRIPETKIVKVPMPVLQLSRLDYASLTPATLKIVDDWAMKAFDLDVNKTYFIKTGTYSSKFDFRNAKVTGEKEVRELGEYLLFIQHQACMMAGPLTQPSIYGVSTTNEWCVREYIEDRENNPCIYQGLPLHTEYRVFVDFDTDEVIGISPYWEPTVMKNRFANENDASSVHKRHDYIVYKMHEETLMNRYNENKDTVLSAVKEFIPDVNLEGQWSIDIMQNGEDFWLIDMATAETSALKECIPKEKLKKGPGIDEIADNTIQEVRNYLLA